MNITIFGTGYVGLVTGACFAEMGNEVVCVDVDEAKVAGLKRGVLPIYEPGLTAMVASNQDAGRLLFTTDAAVGVDHAEINFVAVGTPSDEDGSADLAHVLEAGRMIGAHMTRPSVVVTKSTVPVGAADRLRAAIASALAERGADISFAVLSNPEFLKEGAAVNDFMKPDRIVIGSDRGVEFDTDAARRLERLYAPFTRNHDKVLHMDVRSAELTKYAANVMLATKISLMNEVANLADRLGADIEAVRQGIGADPRIGYHFIYPGCGYGGSCFPKDVRALIRMGRDVGYDTEITRGVAAVNDRQKSLLVDKMIDYFGALRDRTIALWGLAFKPNTDDMREAPSQDVMAAIWAAGGRVRAYDPQALSEASRIYGERPDLVLCATPQETLEDADALAVVTEWNEFRSPDFDAVKAALRQPVVFDGRNLYDPAMLRERGFDHIGIGRGLRHHAAHG
ncbi:MAG: UDP-glucose/GDP-mannose dehydrogenase family protein [Gammaproteobacteria bacterium]|nr:UDP-glucose/GDP-mannose dehydrogenase family protein [Gammaproteobacteria bacterium]